MAINTKERDVFEKQLIFDGSLDKEKAMEAKQEFIELEEDDTIDIS